MKCKKCNNELILSEVEGYKWQCLECDEDFYEFEQDLDEYHPDELEAKK